MNTLNNTQQLTDETLDQATGGGLWCASSLIRKCTAKTKVATSANTVSLASANTTAEMDEDDEHFAETVEAFKNFFRNTLFPKS